MATHAGTVAPGWIEVESGLERDDVGPDATSLSTPTLLKVGLASHLQLDINLSTVRPPDGHHWGSVTQGSG